MRDPFDTLGAEEALREAAGDELEFADVVNRLNPTSDQLQHFAQLRGLKHAELNRQAPFVRNNPPSILNGSLGLQVELRPVAGDPPVVHQVANWMGADAETLPITVTLGNVVAAYPYAKGTAGPGLDNYAIVQFGTRASLATVEIDIGRGCQFTIGASMVTVQVASRLLGNDTLVVAPVLFGMLSTHTVVRTQNITRTIHITDPNAATQYIVPVFAKSLNFLKRDTTEVGKNALITFVNSNLGTVGQIEIPAASQLLTQIPVPPTAYFFSILQGTYAAGVTGNNVAGEAMFNLDL